MGVALMDEQIILWIQIQEILQLNQPIYQESITRMSFCTITPLSVSFAKYNLSFEEDQNQTQESPAQVLTKVALSQLMFPLGFLSLSNHNQHLYTSTPQPNAQFEIHCHQESKTVYIEEKANQNDKEYLWKILNNEQSVNELVKGDRIKIGMSEFDVYSSSHQTQKHNNLSAHNYKNQGYTCRYCFTGNSSPKDPLIRSVKYLHLECLRQWLVSKCQKQSRNNISVFIFKHLQCEICKGNWPFNFRHQKKQYQLIDFSQIKCQREISSSNASLLEQNQQEKGQFIVLKTQSLDEEDEEIILFLKMELDDKSEITFGSDDYEADMAIYTFGVSEIHCKIFVENNKFYIKDNNSKTGTLVSLHKEDQFSNKTGMILQYNRFLINLKMASGFFSCFASEVEYNLSFSKSK